MLLLSRPGKHEAELEAGRRSPVPAETSEQAWRSLGFKHALLEGGASGPFRRQDEPLVVFGIIQIISSRSGVNPGGTASRDHWTHVVHQVVPASELAIALAALVGLFTLVDEAVSLQLVRVREA